MIDEQDIENLKAMLNVVDVVGEKVKLKKSGSDYTGLCPFHDEKTPSFTISPSKQIYKCFGCGKSGDAIQFVIENQGITYPEAIIYLSEKYGIPVEEKKNKEYKKPAQRLQKVGDKMLEYFESRKISNNTLLRFGVTESLEWMPTDGQEVPVICFNYYREGELVI